MTASNCLSYSAKGIKCTLFRDVVSFMQAVCIRLSISENLFSESNEISIDFPLDKGHQVAVSIQIRLHESFRNTESFPHRRNARIKRKDGNIRLVCSIPIHKNSSPHFIWNTNLFEISIQINGSTALIPISIDGHKYH